MQRLSFERQALYNLGQLFVELVDALALVKGGDDHTDAVFHFFSPVMVP